MEINKIISNHNNALSVMGDEKLILLISKKDFMVNQRVDNTIDSNEEMKDCMENYTLLKSQGLENHPLGISFRRRYILARDKFIFGGGDATNYPKNLGDCKWGKLIK